MGGVLGLGWEESSEERAEAKGCLGKLEPRIVALDWKKEGRKESLAWV